MVDYYQILGLDKNATKDDVVKAYRNLAKQHHPDRNIGNKEAEEKFKKIQEAYDILSDDEKRNQYNNPFNNINLDFDIFKQASIQKGNDIFVQVNLTLKEACFGITKEIQYQRGKICVDCQGIGFENLTSCNHCNGTGKIKKVFQQPFQFELLCPTCQGSGKVYKNVCKICNGKKIYGSDLRKLNVKFPIGITEQNNLIIDQEGELCTSGVNGNLVIAIKFLKDIDFQKTNNDLICEKVISYTTFVLGGSVEVETIENEKIEIKIPAGTQVGTNLRIKGKGFCQLNNKEFRGDLITRLNIEIPKNISDLSLFEKLKKAGF